MDKQQAFARLTKAVEYLKDNGKARNQSEIAELIGVLQPHVSSALRGDAKRLTENFLRRFADAYSDLLNKDWLLTGEGRMEKPSKDMRPHYPATVSAGFLGDVSTVTEADVEMLPKIAQIHKDYDFTINVQGDSMNPVLFDGDTLACRNLNRGDELIPGNIYVFDTKTDGAVVKTYLSETKSLIRLHSENPKYKDFSIPKEDIGVAEVVGHVPSNPLNAKDMFKKFADALLSNLFVQKIQPTLSEEEREELIARMMNKENLD
ncbi:MAG: hypothetical protein NC204_05730 [Candidatus Amulumruptor caecigallinarius]|nr:hypothetical protein [Candidatus Amulumruptor caecigallinarius]